MSTLPRPAIQLYSIRELSEPLPDVVRRVADAGLEGVEFANRFQTAEVDALAAAFDETRVEPVGAHVDLELVEDAVNGDNDLLARCEAVGCERVVISHISGRHFRSRDAVRSLSYRLSDLGEALEADGINLGFHTVRQSVYPLLPDGIETLFNLTPLPERIAEHAARGVSRGGRLIGTSGRGTPPSATGLWNLFARTAPDALFFELETAEVRVGGFDPAETLSLFAGRVPLVHLRDVKPNGRLGEFEDVTNGEGVVDFPAVVDAARAADTEWLVYENEVDIDPAMKLEHASEFFDRLLTDALGRTVDGSGTVRSGTAR
jgi:sugar phosphate isomerase/epimerase